MVLMTPASAIDLLCRLGASPRLLRHVHLVGEAGEVLLEAIARFVPGIDVDFVRAGIVLHDTGKVQHPTELDGPGAAHENSGEAMLLAAGVGPAVARVCRSHAQWATIEDCTLEELLITLSDKLWKGSRVRALEERVIDEVASTARRDRSDIFVDLDDAFEKIAARGAERLERSRVD